MGTRFYSSPNPQNGPENEHLRPQSCPRQGHTRVVYVVWFEFTSGELRRQNYRQRQRSWGDHHSPISSGGCVGDVVRPDQILDRSLHNPPKPCVFVYFYYFISTHDFQIGTSAVAGIGAPPVPSRRTHLSPMTAPFGYMFYDKTEIDSEACEVTVLTD